MSTESKIRRQLSPSPKAISLHARNQVFRLLLIYKLIGWNYFFWEQAEFALVQHSMMLQAEPYNMKWLRIVRMVGLDIFLLAFAANLAWWLSEFVVLQHTVQASARGIFVPIPGLQHKSRIARKLHKTIRVVPLNGAI